jgi:hypothetical protein
VIRNGCGSGDAVGLKLGAGKGLREGGIRKSCGKVLEERRSASEEKSNNAPFSSIEDGTPFRKQSVQNCIDNPF